MNVFQNFRIRNYDIFHASSRPAMIVPHSPTCCLTDCMLAWMSVTCWCSPPTVLVRISLSVLRCWRSRSNISLDDFSRAFCCFSCSLLSRSHCSANHARTPYTNLSADNYTSQILIQFQTVIYLTSVSRPKVGTFDFDFRPWKPFSYFFGIIVLAPGTAALIVCAPLSGG